MVSRPPRSPLPPAADLPVDAERVRALVEQLEAEDGVDLAEMRWSIGQAALGQGWDNVLWPAGTLAGEPVVLRVVRRRAALALMRREFIVTRRLRTVDQPLPLRVPSMKWMVNAPKEPSVSGIAFARTKPSTADRTGISS